MVTNKPAMNKVTKSLPDCRGKLINGCGLGGLIKNHSKEL
jgi:hypothetical protein